MQLGLKVVSFASMLFTDFKTVTIGHSDTPPLSRSTVRRFSQNPPVQSDTRIEIRSLVEGFLLDCKVTGKSLATIGYYTENGIPDLGWLAVLGHRPAQQRLIIDHRECYAHSELELKYY